MADDAANAPRAAEETRSATDEATAYFLRFQNGDISVAERYQFVRWLKASPLHIREFLQAARMYSWFQVQRRTEGLAFLPVNEASLLRDQPPKESSLSLTYLRCVIKANYPAKIALTLCASVMGLLSLKYPDWGLVALASAAAGYFALIVLKERIVEYRIRRGFFGTSRSEARELIDFIVKNSADIDFTGGSRERRPALLLPVSLDKTSSVVESIRGRATAP